MQSEIVQNAEQYESLVQQVADDLKISSTLSKVIDDELKQILLAKDDKDELNLLFTLPSYRDDMLNSYYFKKNVSYHKDSTGVVKYFIDNIEVDEDQIIVLGSDRQNELDSYLKKQAKEYIKIAKTLDAYFKDTKIKSSLDTVDEEILSKGFFTAVVTKKDLGKILKKYETVIAGVGLNSKMEYSIAGAMASTQVYPLNQNLDYSGNGIPIYFADTACPYTNSSLFTNFSSDRGSPGDGNPHTMLIAGIIQNVAPNATKRCDSSGISDTLNETLMLNALATGSYAIETYSFNDKKENEQATYTATDRVVDQHVLDSPSIVFVSAGNTYDWIRKPTNAYNAITVGNYDDSNNKLYKDPNTSDPRSSNYKNSTRNNEKPEIVAPGTNITFNGITNTGTSFAAPHAAAFAADMLSSNYALRVTHPIATKALMLAGATGTITDTLGNSDDMGIGAGGINAYSSMIYDRHVTALSDPGNFNPVCTDVNVYLNSWEKARVAMTWTVDPDYVFSQPDIGNIYYFYIYSPNYGPGVATSWLGSINNNNYPNNNSWSTDNWSVAEFDVDVSGTHIIRVCRYDSTRDYDSNIGIAVHAK